METTVDGSVALPTKPPAAVAQRALEAGTTTPLVFRSRWWVRPLMLLVDWAALELALLAAFLLRQSLAGLVPIGLQWDLHYRPLAMGVLILPLGFWLTGLYPGYGKGMVERLRLRTLAILLLFVVLIGWGVVVSDAAWSRGVLLLTLGLSVVACPLAESTLRAVLVRCHCWGTPVVIFGGNRTAERVVANLKLHPELGLVPIAVLDEQSHEYFTGRRVEGVPVFGRLSRALQIARRAKIAIVAMPPGRAQRVVRLAERLPFHRVILVPDLAGLASLWVWSRDLGGILGLELHKNLLRRRNWLVKRSVDYTLGGLMLLGSLPVLAVAVVCIKLVDRGPALFWQERVGLGGRSIRVWKLRTMYANADDRLEAHLRTCPDARAEWQRYCKLRHDPRILPGIGGLLRKTSLDELPQLWNMLRGDMSLVGPRPLPRYHLEKFPAPFRSLRRQVMPGLTGLWQVSARADGDLDTHLALDTYYIRNWSLWLDTYLLLRTVWTVVRGRGAY